MKLWVCSFPSAEHPHWGYFTRLHSGFLVIRSVLERSNALLQCQPLKLKVQGKPRGVGPLLQWRRQSRLCSACAIVWLLFLLFSCYWAWSYPPSQRQLAWSQTIFFAFQVWTSAFLVEWKKKIIKNLALQHSGLFSVSKCSFIFFSLRISNFLKTVLKEEEEWWKRN